MVKLETPGWSDDTHKCSYGLEEYLLKHKGSGSNMLRTPYVSHPEALKQGDILATDNVVLEAPRRGFNSSILVHLDAIGWIELAARLPIALKGNEKFKLPIEFVRGDTLITGCLIVKDASSYEVNWTILCLDGENCKIRVPSCIPLALK